MMFGTGVGMFSPLLRVKYLSPPCFLEVMPAVLWIGYEADEVPEFCLATALGCFCSAARRRYSQELSAAEERVHVFSPVDEVAGLSLLYGTFETAVQNYRCSSSARNGLCQGLAHEDVFALVAGDGQAEQAGSSL